MGAIHQAMLAFKNPSGGGPGGVAGLTAWWKADALSLSDTDPISSWADSSGNGHTLTQATGSKQAVYNTNQLNGLPGATFDGADLMTITDPFASVPLSIFAVLKGSGGFRTIIGGNTGAVQWRIDDGSRMQLLKSGMALIGTSTTALNSSTFYILDVHYSTPNLSFFVDGAADGTASSAQTIVDLVTNVGSSFNEGERFSGVLCELIYYDNVLSGGDQDVVRTYLSDKWGITI